MEADGIIRIFTDVDTSGIRVGTREIENSMNGAAKTVRKIGGLITAAFAVKKIVQFGKDCLDMGSDLQEVQNVVDSVFSTMSDKMDVFAKKAATTAGLSETMAKRYAGTFGAMAKSFQYTEAEAYDMATTLTQLSGDVASFYNITQDEAYTKLKSVFTGETESLKELGVVMTQTALDQFALANGFGKTTSFMTEQEKVALRYKFVMQQLQTASGDFIRTSEGWANQVRILKLQFESSKATIGQGLINVLTPVIKVINLLLAKLSVVASAFRAFSELITGKKAEDPANEITDDLNNGYNEATQSINDYSDATDNASKSVKNARKEAEKYLSPIDQINKYTSSDSIGSSGNTTGYENSNSVPTVDYGHMAQGNTVVDSVNESFTKFFEKIKKYLVPLTEQIERFSEITGKAFGWLMENVLKPLANFTISEVVPRFFEMLANILEIVNNILIALQPLWQWFWDKVLLPIATWTGGVFLDIWDKINGGLKSFADWCRDNPKIIETAAIVVGSFIAAWTVVKVASKIAGIVNAISSVIGVVTTLSSVMGVIPTISMLFGKAITAIASPAGIAVAAIGAIIAVGVLLWKNWDTIKTKAKEIWESIKKTLVTILENIKANISSILEKVKTSILGTWESAKTKTINAWNSIKSTVIGVLEKISRTAGNVGTTIKNALINAFEAVGRMIKTPINSIIGIINGLIRGVVSGINLILQAFNKLNINIPSWVPGIGGRKLAFNFGQITAPQIPYLAQGAVIPPNAPFMAVLGDQKHGNNIETPEALMRKVVREEVGRNAGNYRFTAQINRRTLFDEMISEGILRQASSGINPFELA